MKRALILVAVGGAMLVIGLFAGAFLQKLKGKRARIRGRHVPQAPEYSLSQARGGDKF
jgi:hypothetical protein